MLNKPKLFLLDLHQQTDLSPFDTLDLAQRLLEQGIEVTVFDDLSVFAEQLKHYQTQMAASADQSISTRPSYVVAWVDKGEHTDTQHKTQLSALQTLMTDFQQLMPWVVLSTQEDMSKQIAAFQAGARHYWVQPKDAHELVEKLAQLTGLIEHQPYRVVMVDDSEIVLEVQTALLRHAGIEVWSTENPLELPALLKLVKPDVLVLDLHMPQACGSQVAWAVRQSQSEAELPIVFVSGEDDLAYQLLALKQGGDDFLVKPIKPKQFIETVKMRAQRARQHNRLQAQLKHKLYEQSREHQALNQHAIVSVADRAGNIVLVNDKFCEISGYAREDLIGKNHRLVKSNRHPSAFYQDLWRTIASGEVWQGEICNLSKQGQEYWVKSTITPFLNEAGQVYQYVSIRTDISQIKKLEFEQQQRLHELEQARQEAERIAPSAENGLQQAQAWLPSLILLDINLPGMNGDEAIAHFKAIPGYTQCQPTIYAVTANVLEDQMAHYIECGFDEVIAKPFDIAQIMQRLEATRKNIKLTETS
jgi:PAS domain S-box-containing protein